MASRRPAAQAERLKRPPLSEIAFSGQVLATCHFIAQGPRIDEKRVSTLFFLLYSYHHIVRLFSSALSDDLHCAHLEFSSLSVQFESAV